MNESRKSKRRRKAARSAREWSRARRLSIEAMEGRVLLSGNTLDLSTFVADITPASYGPAIVLSVRFVWHCAERPSHRYEVDDDRSVRNGERRWIRGLLPVQSTRPNTSMFRSAIRIYLKGRPIPTCGPAAKFMSVAVRSLALS